MRIFFILFCLLALSHCGGGARTYVPSLDKGVEIKKLYFNSGRTKVNIMNMQDNKRASVTKGFVVNLYEATDSAIKLMKHSLDSKGFIVSPTGKKLITIKISKIKYSGSSCRTRAEYTVGKAQKKLIRAQKKNNPELPDPWEDICNAAMRDLAQQIFRDPNVLDYLNQ